MVNYKGDWGLNISESGVECGDMCVWAGGGVRGEQSWVQWFCVGYGYTSGVALGYYGDFYQPSTAFCLTGVNQGYTLLYSNQGQETVRIEAFPFYFIHCLIQFHSEHMAFIIMTFFKVTKQTNLESLLSWEKQFLEGI